MTRTDPPRASRASFANLVLPLAVVLLSILAFGPVLQGDFVSWDDDRNFVTNPDYRGLGLAQLRWMWSTFHLGHFIPLSWMSLGLDFKIWGMDARGYHLTNLLLHALAALILYAVARRLLTWSATGDPEEARRTTPVALAAAFGALLFAVHPLRAESVAWITERRDVLSGSFSLLSLYCYVRAAERGPRTARWYWGSVALFLGGVLSKGTVLTLPALLLVLNLYPLRRIGGASGWWNESTRRVYAGLVPFAIVAAAAAVMSLFALQEVPQLPPTGKVAVSLYSLIFYTWKTIAPTELAPLYTMPRDLDPFATRYVLSGVMVLAITATVVGLRRRWPALLATWAVFILALFPMLGFHQNGPQIVADRYTYHAAPVLSLLAAGALLLAFRSRHRRLAIGVSAAVVLVLGTLTWRQSRIWVSSEALWAQVIRVDTAGWIGENNWGNILMGQGRFAEAERHFRIATARNPGYSEAFNNLGVSLLRQGRPADAVEQFRQAIVLRPAYDAAAGALAENNWGTVLMQQGQLAEAERRFRLATERAPDFAEAFNNLGVSLVRQGRAAEAVEPFRRALAIQTTYDEAQVNLGAALAQVGEAEQAIEQYERALRVNPRNTAAYVNWGNVLLRLERPLEAIPLYEAALRIEPGHTVARTNLGVARAMAEQLSARP